MRIFVAGATGVLGQPTVRLLRGAGHDVTGVARTPEKQELLRALGATPVSVNLFDPAAVAAAVAGHDSVIHIATKIPSLTSMRWRGRWKENDRLRREGTRILVDAALTSGVKTFVAESITFVYADGGDAWLAEDSPTKLAWSALDSTMDLERETKRFAGDDRRAIILRFGAFYAPYATSTVDTVKLAKRGMFGVIGKGDNYFSSIHVDDAAAAIVAALGAPAGTYNVTEDDPSTQAVYSEALAAAFGLKKPRHLPKWLGKLILGGPANYILQSQRVSNNRFKEATGWSPRYPDVRAGMKASAEVLGAKS